MPVPAVAAGMSLNDLEYQYLATLGGTASALDDRRTQVYGDEPWAFFAARSGLTPPEAYMVTDHQLAFYRANIVPGDRAGTLSDCARSFWASWF